MLGVMRTNVGPTLDVYRNPNCSEVEIETITHLDLVCIQSKIQRPKDPKIQRSILFIMI